MLHNQIIKLNFEQDPLQRMGISTTKEIQQLANHHIHIEKNNLLVHTPKKRSSDDFLSFQRQQLRNQSKMINYQAWIQFKDSEERYSTKFGSIQCQKWNQGFSNNQNTIFQSLNVSQNQISQILKIISISVYHCLRQLQLRKNLITNIEPLAFINTKNMTEIDLSENNFSQVKIFDKLNFKKIKKVSITQNKIAIFNRTRFSTIDDENQFIIKLFNRFKLFSDFTTWFNDQLLAFSLYVVFQVESRNKNLSLNTFQVNTLIHNVKIVRY